MHVHQVRVWAARLGGAGPRSGRHGTRCSQLPAASFQLPRRLEPVTWLFGITDKLVRHRRRKDAVALAVRFCWCNGWAAQAAGPDPLRLA